MMKNKEERWEKMKRNKIIKTIIIILISLLFIYILTSNTFAAINADDYYPGNGTESHTGTSSEKLKNIGNDIIGVLHVIGTVLSVAVLGILGIKYMLGSVEERAEYKKTLMPYFIGAIMIFSITNVLKIVVAIAKEIF